VSPRGTRLNLLFLVVDDFSGLDGSELWEDMKGGGSVGLKHRSAWRSIAVVTDKDWIRHATASAGWLAPGELRIFDPGQEPEATAWLRPALAVLSGLPLHAPQGVGGSFSVRRARNRALERAALRR